MSEEHKSPRTKLWERVKKYEEDKIKSLELFVEKFCDDLAKAFANGSRYEVKDKGLIESEIYHALICKQVKDLDYYKMECIVEEFESQKDGYSAYVYLIPKKE